MKIDLNFAGDLLAGAIRHGADEAEVFVHSSKRLSIEIKDQEVDALTSSSSAGYSLRVIKKKRLGFSYSTDPGNREEVIRNAVAAADGTDPDEHLTLPAASDVGSVDIFDPSLGELGEEEAIGLTRLVEKAALELDSRVRRVRKASGTFSASETVICNSKAVSVRYLSTSCSAQVLAVAEDDGESQTGWDYSGSRFLRDVAFGEVGKNAARQAIALLGARRIEGGRADVVLDTAVVADFIGVLASSFSSEAVQKGRSLLSGRLGNRVLTPLLDIVDSGILSGRLGSRPVDDEGVATQEKDLVREGILIRYLHNTHTACKDRTVSTGNAVRGGFSALPSVGVTNLLLRPASGVDALPADSLCRALHRGLFVLDAMGIHTMNPVSGDFSIGVTGLWVEGGEVKHPVKEAVIAGNLLDFFGRVEAAADDFRFHGNVGAPSLVITGVDISA